MDLRDQFAVHIAAALVGALTDHESIARRSYDLAEAMLAERGRRIDQEEQRSIAAEVTAPPVDDAPPFAHRIALLDEPAPIEDEAEEVEPPYDPTWDLDPVKEISRPGLARTQPEAEETRQARTA